jgi:thymidylate kinase
LKSLENGLFISFEGIDGAGKSTHIDALVAAFKAEFGADKVIQTREPGGTPLAEKLRQLRSTPRPPEPSHRTRLSPQ